MTSGMTAVADGRAWVDLSSWWKVAVGGADALQWLNDLLSAELAGLEPGHSRPTFLLTPTGRIRASASVIPHGDGYLLLQDPSQPERIDGLLDRYVLSSDVRLEDVTDSWQLLAVPGGDRHPEGTADAHSPSVLGPGYGLLLEAGEAASLDGLVEARPEDVESWRVRRGIARFGADLGPDSLPHEVETGESVAYGKGCFLGQEAVAKVRNLGHPPFVLLAASARGRVSPGDEINAEASPAGVVTSTATESSNESALIARVRWALKDAKLMTAAGVELRDTRQASAS